MIKGQDVVVLLKLLGSEAQPPMRELANQLQFDLAGTQRSLRRLSEVGLYSAGRRRISEASAEEFLLHAVKFSFPPRRGSEVRGLPTSWGAEPLNEELAESDALSPVWPSSKGEVRGIAFEPLHPMVPEAALADPELWRRLALLDAIRGHEGARVTRLAERLLRERIKA